MKQLDDFLTRLSPLVPGCPHPVAIQALRDASIELCERSSVVQVFTDAISLSAGVAEYDVPVDNGVTVHRVLKAWHGSRLLALLPREQVTAKAPFVAADSSGTPVGLYPTGRDVVVLFPTPDADSTGETVRLEVAVKPTRTATAVPDELFDDWVEVVVHGALARLAVQPGTPYSNPDLAAMGAAGFINGVGRAKKAAAKGKTRSDLRMAGRTFAHGRYTIGAGL